MKLDFPIGVVVGAVVVYGWTQGWLDSVLSMIPGMQAMSDDYIPY